MNPILLAFTFNLTAARSFFCPPCLPPTRQEQKTLHTLYPQDIKAVMAMGDSITAAFGIYGKPLEYRGSSFVTGANKGVMTLANLFKEFSPKIVGGSHDRNMVQVHVGYGQPFFFMGH